jgi:hypothetical protein
LNTRGIGAKVTIYCGDNKQYLEQMPTRGFQSSVSAIMHFGTGSDKTVDSLHIEWQSGKQQMLKDIAADRQITLEEKRATTNHHRQDIQKPLFAETKSPISRPVVVNTINDFKRQRLLTNSLSFFGPCMAKGDVNGDKLEDIYVGGGSGQPGTLFIQKKNGQFIQKAEPAFDQDKNSEDADVLIADLNGDGFPDLYVASGGYHQYAPEDTLLQDRLYLNDGKGNFTKANAALPAMHVSKSCVRMADVNGDGYPDLFVGGRTIPGRYPEIPESYILINDGKGHFKDQTTVVSASLEKIGMVTDAAWIDLNGDNKKDLLLVGEWMPVTVFINVNGKLVNKTDAYFDKEYSGWWNKILINDFNGDGRPDLFIGNFGLNAQCKVSEKEPAEMYYKDFDGNGVVDPVLCFYIQGKSYPYVSRDEMLDQVNSKRMKFPDYKSYADATLKDIFTGEELRGAGYLKADHLATSYFQSGSDGKFHEKALPLQAQFAPVFAMDAMDYDQDGKPDILLCGNINHARLRFGKYDANYGVLLKGDGRGGFTYIPQSRSGFNIQGDVRSLLNIGNDLIFGINQKEIKAYKRMR